MNNKQKSWHIGDTHFHHHNVLRYGERPFKDLENMHKRIISNWNNVVKKYDKVFFHGDFSFGTKEETEVILKQLNGNKVLIKGNHDTRSNDWWREIGFREISKYPIVLPEYKMILSHQPIPIEDNIGSYVNVHAHVHQHIEEHEITYPNKYKCVSVECINYTPISTEELLNGIGL